MSLQEMWRDLMTAAWKSAPPILVQATVTARDLTLQDWVYIGTLAWLALQAAWLVWKWYRAANKTDWNPQ